MFFPMTHQAGQIGQSGNEISKIFFASRLTNCEIKENVAPVVHLARYDTGLSRILVDKIGNRKNSKKG